MYAVVMISNLEIAPVGIYFDSYIEAYACFEWKYSTLFENEKANGLLDLEGCHFNIDDDYAIVQYIDGAYIKFILVQMFEPSYEFKEYYKGLKEK